MALAMVLFAGGLHAIDRGERWRRHAARLAAEPGEREAARYIAAQLAEAGVGPALQTGYTQPVKLRSRQILEAYSSLFLVRDGVERRLVPGEDAVIDLSFDPGSGTRSPMVFAGYGISSPELGYDDLAGLDLRGKIAVVLAGGPPSLPVNLRAHFQSVEERNIALRRKAGAYGIITIPNPRNDETGWRRAASRRLEPAVSPADPAFEQDDDLELSVVMNPERAEMLFEGSGHTFREVLEAAAAGRPLPRFPLAAGLRASVATERRQTESQNIVGVLRGSDPALREEYVALSARLGDSGAARLLDVAESLHEAGVKLRRSLLFVFLTAEDRGLAGSQFFTHYPTVSAGSIVADLDVASAERGSLPITVAAADESDLGELIRAASLRACAGIRPEGSELPGSYYSFLLHGTPSAGFRIGGEADRPGDGSGAQCFDDMLLTLTQAVANRAAKPHWAAGSYFGQPRR